MRSPCDAERHYHDVSAGLSLAAGTSRPATCQCGGGVVNVSRSDDAWSVALVDGTPVLAPMVDGITVAGTEVVVGVRRPYSEA